MQTKKIVEDFMSNEENEYWKRKRVDEKKTQSKRARGENKFLLFHLLFSME